MTRQKANMRYTLALALLAMVLGIMSHTTPLWVKSVDGTPIVICSAFGTKTIIIDENGKEVPQDSGTRIAQCTMCLNASMQALDAYSHEQNILPPSLIGRTQTYIPQTDLNIRSAQSANYSIRAPPTHS